MTQIKCQFLFIISFLVKSLISFLISFDCNFQFTVIYFNRYFWQGSDLSAGRCGEEKHIHWRQNRWKLFISNDCYSFAWILLMWKYFIQLFYWTVHPESTGYWKYLISSWVWLTRTIRESYCMYNNGNLHLQLPEMSDWWTLQRILSPMSHWY